MNNIDNATFKVVMRCRDCGTQLNETKDLSAIDLWNAWTSIVLTSGFNAGKCPSGCRATFSDLNINTGLVIVDVNTGKDFELQAYKFLAGKFYTGDYIKVCDCKDRNDDEIYISDKYPAVHGVCGKWIKKYKDKHVVRTLSIRD